MERYILNKISKIKTINNKSRRKNSEPKTGNSGKTGHQDISQHLQLLTEARTIFCRFIYQRARNWTKNFATARESHSQQRHILWDKAENW